MNVTFYSNFSKKANSTKQPSGGTIMDVKLKKETSVLNPTFLIDGIDTNYDYAYWNGRYYKVRDIVLNLNNIYEINCEVDNLASHKTEIGNYTGFVARSETAYDPMINDEKLTSRQEIKNTTRTINTGIFESPGCYLFTFAGKDGIVLAACSDLNVIQALYNNTAYQGSQQALDNLVDQVEGFNFGLIGLSEYLGAPYWVPFNRSSIATQQITTLKLGWWGVSMTGQDVYKVDNPYIHIYNPLNTLNMPVNDYNDFRAASDEYSQYSIYLPGIGTMPLNAEDAYEGDITVEADIDLYTGAIAYILKHGQYIIGNYNGTIKVDIPISSNDRNIAEGFITAAGMTIGALAGTGSMSQGGLMDAVKNTVNPRYSINGGDGNMPLMTNNAQIIVTLTNYDTKDYPIYTQGRPLYEYRQISTLPGYVQTIGASVDIVGLASEREAVNAALDGGIYYE